MNYLVDIMVVGDSKCGHEILDSLATSKPNVKFAFISQAFKSTTTHDYVNVKYFKDEVAYVSYRHRLFCCYLQNGDHVYGTHLIIASGLTYEPLVVNNEQVPCVFNTVDDVPKAAKDQPALVICNQDSDAKFALEVAKKYKQVYLCTKEVDITNSVSAVTAKKLAKAENLAVLPNASIKKVVSDKDVLQKVMLDNYSEINCAAIYAKTTAKPATEFIPRKILPREDGYPAVAENCESTLVPKCFAAGNCLKKYTKAMEQKLLDTILKDF
jgi:thioredoxin reductase